MLTVCAEPERAGEMSQSSAFTDSGLNAAMYCMPSVGVSCGYISCQNSFGWKIMKAFGSNRWS